jgi:hypothetical protein
VDVGDVALVEVLLREQSSPVVEPNGESSAVGIEGLDRGPGAVAQAESPVVLETDDLVAGPVRAIVEDEFGAPSLGAR